MNGIIGTTELLLDTPLSPEQTELALTSRSSAESLLRILDDILDFSKIEAGRLSLEQAPFRVAPTCSDVMRMLAIEAQEKGVELLLSIEPDVPAVVIGDSTRLRQVLVNLIGNAVRYSPEESAVWVRSEIEGDTAVIIVADQGKGIALDDQQRIFEKFERVDPSEPGGSGLGLYISRRLARAMGGDITVDSAPGQGARFILTLRRAPEGIGA